MCICAETMILSRNGFTGSVTKACRIDPVSGSGTPASAATGVDQPAVALRTTPAETSPWFVLTGRTSSAGSKMSPSKLQYLTEVDHRRHEAPIAPIITRNNKNVVKSWASPIAITGIEPSSNSHV